jgi:Protein of unknown function (DUF2911)
MTNRVSRVLVVALALAAVAFAQTTDKSKRPSPPGQAKCSFSDGKQVSIDYSRPSMKGRKIYGGLVPWDKEWRTGANEATTFVVNTDVNVGGTAVPAGSYTLYTVPSGNGWQLVISKKTGQWGIPYPGKEFDFARIPMQTSALPSAVEQFTISFDQKDKTCTLNVDWETTRASIAVEEK